MKTLAVALMIAALIAKTDMTQLAAWGGIILAAASLIRAVTTDPRTSRLAERKENAELRKEVDELYRDKRAAEDRERDAIRRADRLEQKLETAENHITRLTAEQDISAARIAGLEGDVRKWRLIAGDLRRGES